MRLCALLLLTLLATAELRAQSQPSDLPLHEHVNASAAAQPFSVILLSGDGGYNATEQGMGKQFADAGIPVLGIDSLKYFWRERRPEQIATDLERLMRYGIAQFHRERFVLIGYSFGADVLPFAIRKLPADLQTKIVQLVLLSPSRHAEFEVHMSGWFGIQRWTGPRVGPELAKLDKIPTLCFYGLEEQKPACPAFASPTVTVVPHLGGHRIGGAFEPVVLRILTELRRRG